MKLAVLSDVHSNWVALQAVSEHLEGWQPDQVVVAGDLVNRGPRPLECLRYVQEMERTRGWLTVVGNHEQYVMDNARPDLPMSGGAFEIRRSSYWTYCQLKRDIAPLQAMPFACRLHAPDGGEIRLTHASMLGTRAGVYWYTSDATLRKLAGTPPPALFCVGHTHLPLVRQVGQTLVVNAGSAGLPFDGDTRLSYAQLTWHREAWEAKIVRLDYDRAQAEHDFTDSGFLDEGGPLARLILIELRTGRSQLFQWSARYDQAVRTGEISLEESVQQFLC